MTLRALFAAGIFLALLVAGVLLIRRDEQAQFKPAKPPAAEAPAPLAAPSPPLARADLLDAAARAADAEARGVPAPPDLRLLVGRRFILKLPFGCGGPEPEDSQASLRWSYDEGQETLRATVTPEVWTGTGFVRALAAGTAYEAAEGFWIERPWMRVGECPRAAARPAARVPQNDAGPAPSTGSSEIVLAPEARAAPLPRTLGVVELFEPDSRRAARRNGRPYEVTARVGAGELDHTRGLRLVLEGRLAPLSLGRPVACRSEDADRPPLCLIGVEVERVAVTDGSGQHLLAEWRD